MRDPWECDYVDNLLAQLKVEPSRVEQPAKARPPRPNHLSGLALARMRRDAGIPLSPELAALLAQHEKVRA